MVSETGVKSNVINTARTVLVDGYETNWENAVWSIFVVLLLSNFSTH